MTGIATRPEVDEMLSEYGATVKDAIRLMRRASRCYVFFRTGSAPNHSALFELPMRAVRAELKRLTPDTAMPCELARNVLAGWSIYFGGSAAIENAARARR